MKKCFKCRALKPITEFYKHKAMADGHLNKCKSCTKQDVIKHRAENDSVREYDRRRYQRPERKAYQQSNVKRWRAENPEKYKAQTAVGNAVRDGRLVKGDVCERCGAEDHIHAHHSDYSKPLEVEWLCARCHHVGHSEVAFEGE